MRFIVGRKQINLSRFIVVAFSAIVALSGTSLGVKAEETQLGNSRRTFADWCRQKADLSPEAKHTVEVLLQNANTTECDAANQRLVSIRSLDLSDKEISDIKPLESLTNLTILYLIHNKISDIKPLESLTNLTRLGLTNNKISDIKPLEFLTNLTDLFLDKIKSATLNP